MQLLSLKQIKLLTYEDDTSTNRTLPSGDAMMVQAEDTDYAYSGLMRMEMIESFVPKYKGTGYYWTCHNCGFGEHNYHETPWCIHCSHHCCTQCTVRVLMV